MTKMWGNITLEPSAGSDIEKSAKAAYEFMLDNLGLSYGWSFHFNDKTIDMTPFEDYMRVHKRPSEIVKEYWSKIRNETTT